jgi:heat shock protein HslJ
LPALIEGQASPTTQPGKIISDLDNTFWLLRQIQGSNADLSSVIINIEFTNPSGVQASITFSTPSYSISFPFQYKPTGLELFPAYAHRAVTESDRLSQDQQAAQLFESALHRTCCYELRHHVLTLADKDRNAIIVLSPVRQKSIENRHWRIARYGGDGANLAGTEGLIEAKYPGNITFLNGQVYGSPGCGGLVGSYKVSGGQFASDIGFLLAGFCTPDQFAQDSLVMKALKSVRQIQRNGRNILLRDASGRAQLLLVPF